MSETQKTAWRPVAAELPKDGEYVLLRNEEEGKPPHIGWAVYWGTGEFNCFVYTDEAEDFVPTEWAPIPS